LADALRKQGVGDAGSPGRLNIAAAAFLARNVNIGRAFPPYLTWERITVGLPEENQIAQQQLREILHDTSK